MLGYNHANYKKYALATNYMRRSDLIMFRIVQVIGVGL